MSKREAFYDTLVYESDTLSLPEDEGERKESARSLFGATMVACVDVLIEGAGRIVTEHEEFAGFTAEQEGKILALVSRTAYGVLYWQCVKLDRFYGAALEMSVTEQNGRPEKQRSTTIVGPAEEEMHHSYFDWAERFGDHYDEDAVARFSPSGFTRGPKPSGG